jgi:NADH dehydrogenase
MVITGAFSYTGKYATRLLLERGHKVRTLTGHQRRKNPFGDQVQVYPYNFENREALVDSLRGVSTLINTYWVRFPHGSVTFEAAVRNTQLLIEAAKSAGVERIVHVSIANPSLDSPLGYYRGKAELERAVMDSGLSYAIVRPTVIFGTEDILINNLAWFLRKFLVFAIPGDGQYRVRPIYVEDMAALLVASAESRSNTVTNAVGPETFTFHELVRTIGDAIGNSPALLHVPAAVAYAATRVTGWFLGDVILTWEEYKGLMAGLLAPEGPATGETCLTRWLAENAKTVGRKYASEVARHYSIQNHF